MYTIAIVNHKGGVGKTVSTVTVGALSAAQGVRTLLVDVDAQAHTTLYVFGERVFDRDLSDVILAPHDLRDVIQPSGAPNLDVAPASLRVAELDLRLMTDTGRRDRRLAQALDSVAELYDLVLIDCPPALSLLVINALAAADAVIAPVALTNFALRGLQHFLGWLEQFRQEGIVSAQLLAIVPTMVDPRNRADREGLDELRRSGLPLVPGSDGEPVLIPRRTGIEALEAAHVPPVLGAGIDDLAIPYSQVTRQVLVAAGLAPVEPVAAR